MPLSIHPQQLFVGSKADASVPLEAQIHETKSALQQAVTHVEGLSELAAAWQLIGVFLTAGLEVDGGTQVAVSLPVEQALDRSRTCLADFLKGLDTHKKRLSGQLVSNDRLIHGDLFQDFDLGGRVRATQREAGKRFQHLSKFLMQQKSQVEQAEQTWVNCQARVSGVQVSARLAPAVDALIQTLPH